MLPGHGPDHNEADRFLVLRHRRAAGRYAERGGSIQSASMSATNDHPRPTLAQLAWLFLKLGCTAFGGPAAHVALMEHEVVTRRRWMTRERFLDVLAACNLIPGPNS